MLPNEETASFELIAAPDEATTLEWATALAAAGIEYELDFGESGLVLQIPLRSATAARTEIEGFEKDNQNWPPPPRPQLIDTAPRYDTWSPAWVVGMLVAFYVWLGPYERPSALLQAAAADAERIRSGEWWRVVTALCIHADLSHLAGNLVSLFLFGRAMCRIVGPGVGWFLILAAGIAGNAASACLVGADRISVGASTAGFGALGALAMRQTVRRLRLGEATLSIWDRSWIPIGAGLALLASLGTSSRADLGGHALGFLCGALVAIPVAWPAVLRTPRWLQNALLFLSLCVVMGAWRTALNAAR
jgi:rhomboid protease GluP